MLRILYYNKYKNKNGPRFCHRITGAVTFILTEPPTFPRCSSGSVTTVFNSLSFTGHFARTRFHPFPPELPRRTCPARGFVLPDSARSYIVLFLYHVPSALLFGSIHTCVYTPIFPTACVSISSVAHYRDNCFHCSGSKRQVFWREKKKKLNCEGKWKLGKKAWPEVVPGAGVGLAPQRRASACLPAAALLLDSRENRPRSALSVAARSSRGLG